MKPLIEMLSSPGRIRLSGTPGGMDALVLSMIAGDAGRDVVFVARDDVHMNMMAEALAFFSPGLERLELPAWDCLPYDRVSPNSSIAARRIEALSKMLETRERGRLVLTTVSALLQRVPPRRFLDGAALDVAPGLGLQTDSLIETLAGFGYGRSETVMEPGEFAVRGGIVDIFPPGHSAPVRLDFLGDEVEAIRVFDPATQRTTGTLEGCSLKPVSEVLLNDQSISRFRSGYRELFGAPDSGDPLYRAVSEGRRHIGLEHWLALFHEPLETLFDYAPGAVFAFDHQAADAADARFDLIDEYYQARTHVLKSGMAVTGAPYNPVPPERLYFRRGELDDLLVDRAAAYFSPFAAPQGNGAVDAGARPGRDFTDIRINPEANVFDALCGHIKSQLQAGIRVIVAGHSNGSTQRLAALIAEHGHISLKPVDNFQQAGSLPSTQAALAVFGLEKGFATSDLAVITETDILGQRLGGRPARRRVRPENFIAEASSIAEGDLVVHMDHGVARFEGLLAIEAGGAPHDCLTLVYDGGDKLFLPVENIEMISRYGSEQAGVRLDRLGGAAWQARKAKLKQRIRDMAGELIKVAAARSLRPAARIIPEAGLFDEFCAGFPYAETEDQGLAIAQSLDDLARGWPADRLICGDVGFGKTEVALRSAFAAVMASKQVAVVVPTTLLCRQHYRTFTERFKDFPVRVEQMSRMVSARNIRQVKAGLKDGTVDIVIGTHALLAKDLSFRDLGLLVIDEEQHFGVAHKERLKRLKSDVHVLTLTATPIPRTLQLALSGVKEMSLIATPPVDRLAIRTFILPFDPVIVREAIIRERFRGGQTFYVCPRIVDIEPVARQLEELVPEVSMVTAHGRMPARELEEAMDVFCGGGADVLLSTNIIESGLDLPAVNTIIVHRADRFGLSQLYQLRGRVGRSNIRAYAYLTLAAGQKLSAAAEKRLEVMQALDTLGAGFSLASHDLDIRGAGNLLGGEQSGHIREVGIELYQQMLEEAVAEARGLDGGGSGSDEWSPQIGLGMAVLIPDTFVSDLGLRMGLYKRLAWISESEEIDGFAAEMIDRFGPLPGEVENLLKTVAIKLDCKRAGIEKIEAGPKGAVVWFRGGDFANIEGLIGFITEQASNVSLRPDHKLVYRRRWDSAQDRMEGVKHLTKRLAEIAGAGEKPGLQQKSFETLTCVRSSG